MARRSTMPNQHLVVYGAQARLTSPGTWPAMRQLSWTAGTSPARSIAAVATAGAGPDDVDKFASMLRIAATPEVLVALQEAAVHHQPQLRATYPRIRVPTLVRHRQGDSLVPPLAAAEIAADIPGARLELLEGGPHVHFVGCAPMRPDAPVVIVRWNRSRELATSISWRASAQPVLPCHGSRRPVLSLPHHLLSHPRSQCAKVGRGRQGEQPHLLAQHVRRLHGHV